MSCKWKSLASRLRRKVFDPEKSPADLTDFRRNYFNLFIFDAMQIATQNIFSFSLFFGAKKG